MLFVHAVLWLLTVTSVLLLRRIVGCVGHWWCGVIARIKVLLRVICLVGSERVCRLSIPCLLGRGVMVLVLVVLIVLLIMSHF